MVLSNSEWSLVLIGGTAAIMLWASKSKKAAVALQQAFDNNPVVSIMQAAIEECTGCDEATTYAAATEEVAQGPYLPRGYF